MKSNDKTEEKPQRQLEVLYRRIAELEQAEAKCKRAEEEIQLLLTLTQAIGECQDFYAVLEVAISTVCESTGWDYGEAWVPNHDGKVLEHSSVWYSSINSLEKFGQVSDEFTFRPNQGLPGRVWASKIPEWIPNVSSEPEILFPRAKMALEAGLKAGFGVPIIAGGRVLAVLVFFMFKSREEDTRLVELVSVVATQLGSVIQRKRMEEERERLMSAYQEQNKIMADFNLELEGALARTKRAEEELRREKERAEGYLNIASVMLATVNANEEITLINKKGCEILGYKEEELIGKSWFDTLVPQRIREERRSTFHSIIAGETEQINPEYPLLTKSGEEVLIAYHNAVIRDSNGEIVGVLCSGEDITELRKAQEQLQHSQLLASLGKMTAGIAHEVNNPLSSVLLCSELVLRSNIPSQTRKDLRVIHDEAKRAARIMTDLLIYSRRVKPPMRRLDLHSVLKKILDMRRYEQRGRNISVSANLLGGPLNVKGDSSQLMQVFMNLILNAEDVLKESKGGKIIISTQIDGEWTKVSIADDGTGIPEENLNQVFYPFFSTKGVGEGTGLGLSTCYGIVTAHGGLIHVENNEMGGATFTVELPLAKVRAHESLPQGKKRASLVTT